MRFDADNNRVILDSGRILGANGCLFGIGPDLILHEGYDGVLESYDWRHDSGRLVVEDRREGVEESPLTAPERQEIAAAMILLWQDWTAKATPSRVPGAAPPTPSPCTVPAPPSPANASRAATNGRRLIPLRSNPMSAKHPGFQKVQNKIAAKEGVSKAAAGRILGYAKAHASAKAIKANPALKHTAGSKRGK